MTCQGPRRDSRSPVSAQKKRVSRSGNGAPGRRSTLRIVAEHGDIWNTFYGDLEHYRHLLDVLAGHCADVGRDPGDVRKSLTFRAVLDEDEDAARERVRALYGDQLPEQLQRMMVVGTPEQCVEQLRPYADLGVGDFLLGAMAPVAEQTIALVATSVAPALRAAVTA